MSKDELISNQALEIANLKEEARLTDDMLSKARLHFIAIGAPMNDNKLQFNNEQLQWCRNVYNMNYNTNNWKEVQTELPPNGVLVSTKVDDSTGIRNEQALKRQNNLWFLSDGSMYVYYTPTHWKPL